MLSGSQPGIAIDGRLIAVDAATGKSCENFGTHGEVSLLKGLGETVPGFVAMTYFSKSLHKRTMR